MPRCGCSWVQVGGLWPPPLATVRYWALQEDACSWSLPGLSVLDCSGKIVKPVPGITWEVVANSQQVFFPLPAAAFLCYLFRLPLLKTSLPCLLSVGLLPGGAERRRYAHSLMRL